MTAAMTPTRSGTWRLREVEECYCIACAEPHGLVSDDPAGSHLVQIKPDTTRNIRHVDGGRGNTTLNKFKESRPLENLWRSGEKSARKSTCRAVPRWWKIVTSKIDLLTTVLVSRSKRMNQKSTAHCYIVRNWGPSNHIIPFASVQTRVARVYRKWSLCSASTLLADRLMESLRCLFGLYEP